MGKVRFDPTVSRTNPAKSTNGLLFRSIPSDLAAPIDCPRLRLRTPPPPDSAPRSRSTPTPHAAAGPLSRSTPHAAAGVQSQLRSTVLAASKRTCGAGAEQRLHGDVAGAACALDVPLARAAAVTTPPEALVAAAVAQDGVHRGVADQQAECTNGSGCREDRRSMTQVAQEKGFKSQWERSGSDGNR